MTIGHSLFQLHSKPFSQTFPNKTKKRVCVHKTKQIKITKKNIFVFVLTSVKVDRDPETGPGLELEIVDLEGLRGPQVELRDPDWHEASEVFQCFDQTHVDVGIIGHATLQVICELIFLSENKLYRSENDEDRCRLHGDREHSCGCTFTQLIYSMNCRTEFQGFLEPKKIF